MRTLCYVVLMAVLSSCGQEDEKYDPGMKVVTDQLVDANRILRQKESDAIDAKVHHLGWDMKTSGTGLRYMFEEKGSGDTAAAGTVATIEYKIVLLESGDVCYSSDSTGPIKVVVGKDYVETGLHEAIQMMRAGDKAVFILPSHLAHGLLGDWEKIPPLAPVVYHIRLMKVEK
ncbi:MAG: FKBP-type peptidyl-prolyl cis-trans isomerase [Bacteroidia bacterium]|nr:FKBP-type peptidyl-prolyl cis-trans isomerase [Bacteroidia bacterium]